MADQVRISALASRRMVGGRWTLSAPQEVNSLPTVTSYQAAETASGEPSGCRIEVFPKRHPQPDSLPEPLLLAIQRLAQRYPRPTAPPSEEPSDTKLAGVLSRHKSRLLDGDSASQSDILSAAAWQDPSRRLPLVSEPSIKEAPLFTQGELPLTALAALAAGAKPDKLPELVEQIRHRLDQIRKALPPGAEPTRGNYFRLLTQMHRQIFTAAMIGRRPIPERP